MSHVENRRPLKLRDVAWVQALAARLAAAKVRPDLISAASVAFAVLGGALMVISGLLSPLPRSLALIAGAACIQGRLTCNLLDGMIALDHGQGSPAGPIWNELPDRIADVILLAGAGYGLIGLGWTIGQPLGWIAAVLAVLCAYVRELGQGLGLPADFSGPMAKPHRMTALIITLLASSLDPVWGGAGQVMLLGLTVITVVTGWTLARRVNHLAMGLKRRS